QGRKIPDRAPALEACYRSVIDAVGANVDSARRALFIGGKSMGGRIATQVAAADSQLPLAGLVLLGYPLHPPGKPTERRDKHLPSIGRPMLFVQGARDAFGTPAELAPILATLQPPPVLYAVALGDHSFKLSRKDPAAQAQVYSDIQRAIVSFVSSAPLRRRPPRSRDARRGGCSASWATGPRDRSGWRGTTRARCRGGVYRDLPVPTV